ncbi:unnamed protein product [Cuscuta campestris]|uniref:Uncharacterized protein n=1 Tax=Cuscuta campestris TaxID=132261 RepID=A0A484NLF0_9ASTE|nr:unnamed protein product [Cuscuta campestris]
MLRTYFAQFDFRFFWKPYQKWKASFVRLLRSRPPAAWNPLPAAASRCSSRCSIGSSSSSNRGNCFSGFRLIGSRYCSSVVAGGYGDGRAEGKGSAFAGV